MGETASAARPGMTAQDLYDMKWAGDARLSPDNREVVYVVTSIDREDNRYRSQLWIAPLDGGEPRQFTYGPGRDTSPRWSPDGRQLLFVSDRGGKKQLYVVNRDGGEARQVTELEKGVSSPAWSPDSRSIAFVSRLLENSKPENGEPNNDESQEESDVRVVTRLRYKNDGQGWWDGSWAQVFTVDVDTGKTRQVTEGPYDHGSPVWSPDGRYLLVVADRAEDADYTSRSDLWRYDLADDEGEPVKLTTGEGPVAAPAWSPGGRLVAYAGHDSSFGGATLLRLYVVDAERPGEVHCITGEFDRAILSGIISDMAGFSPGSGLQWSPDGERVYFTAAEGGAAWLFGADIESGEVEAVLADARVLQSVDVGSDGESYAAVISTPELPSDVVVGLLGGEEQLLTGLNDALLSERRLGKPERLTFEGSGGRTIEGWLMYPPDYDPESGEKVPMVLQIHGGPHAAYGHSFFHEFQVLAGRGYAVLYTNPHGSQGYGQEFVAATHHDWGGKDYRDLIKAVDHALSLGTIDESRLGVAGGSFGGYMTNWMIGHTDKFAAAVAMRSTSNRYSMFGTKDFGYRDGSFEFDGSPWENPDHYLERSPITYVENIHTPLLLIHSTEDHRCPLEQAEQMYTALKWLRREVQLVTFPGESHGLSRAGQPRHRVERLDRIADWFDRHLLGD